MVRKRDDLGGYYHEPPYTEAELADLRARMNNGAPMTFVLSRPGPSFNVAAFGPPRPASEQAAGPPPAPSAEPPEPDDQ